MTALTSAWKIIRSVRLRKHWLVVLALVPVACGPVFHPPEPRGELLSRSESSPAVLQRGFAVHQEKCGKCHAFVHPAGYDPDDLTRRIIPLMARKSKINTADEKAVLAYLLAAREQSAH